MEKCPKCGFDGPSTEGRIHPIEVGKKFAQYDYKPGQEEDHELWDEHIEFSYYNRTSDSIVKHSGTVSGLDGRSGGLYWIRVKIDGGDKELDLDDIGVVRSPERSRAHLGPLTALEIGSA